MAVAPHSLPFVCVALIFLVVYAGIARSKRSDLSSFWDARVYATAIEHFRSGADPYAPSADGMDFSIGPATGIFLAIFGSLLLVLLQMFRKALQAERLV